MSRYFCYGKIPRKLFSKLITILFVFRVELAPVVIGYSYSLAPPLSPVTCQRCIISLLIPLGENDS